MSHTNRNLPIKGATTLIMLSIISHCINAQTSIVGVVISEDDIPISFANVMLLDSNDSTLIRGEISNMEGQFAITDVTDGSYLLHMSMIGYLAEYIPLEAKSIQMDLGRLVLAEDTRQLEEVVITAKKPLYEKQIDRTIVNVQSSITSSGKTALQILQRSPGVSINQQNNSISMRGKGGVLVMINGKMSRLPIDAVVQMLDGMSAANIEKIELITTPPAKYDAEGDAGIINIVMVKNTSLGTNGNFGISAGYNQKETLGSNFNLNHRGKHTNYFMDYSINSDRNQEEWVEDRFVNNTSFERSVNSASKRDVGLVVQNLRAGLEYEISPRTSARALLTAYRRHWTTDALTETTNIAATDSTVLTSMDLHEKNVWQSISGAFGLTHQLSEQQQISFDFDYLVYGNNNPSQYDNSSAQLEGGRRSENIIDVTKRTPISFQVSTLDYSNQLRDNFSIELGAKATISSFNNRVQVRTFELGNWVINPEFTNTSDLNEKIWAAYGSLSWHPTKDLTIKSGLRYEFTDSFISTPEQRGLVDREFGNVFPSLFISKQFGEESKLQLAYSRRINRPTFNDMAPFVFFSGPNSIYAGNPGLLPAIHDGVDLSYLLNQWWVAIGYSDTNNNIGWLQPEIDPVTNEQVFRSHNLDYLRTLSISTGISLNVTAWWEIQNDAVLYYQTFKTRQFENDFKERVYTVNLNSTSSFSLPRNYSIELSGNYQNNVLYGIWKNKPMGQVDIGFRKELNESKGTLTLAFADIFHTNVWEWDANIPEVDAYLVGLLDQKLRSVNLTYTRSFGNGKLKAVDIGSSSNEERGRVN